MQGREIVAFCQFDNFDVIGYDVIAVEDTEAFDSRPGRV